MVSEMPPLGQLQSDQLDDTPKENSEVLQESLPSTTSEDRCDVNPDFAVICSFITLFGDKLELELNIEQLKSAIEDLNQLDENLIELHVKLLKKVRRYFVRDQWERTLIRFASEFSYDDANEVEHFGYSKTKPSTRIHLLRRLVDAQFECNQKFKAAVNLCEANDLRIQPLGRDLKGNTYWERTDKEGSVRIFQEEPLDFRTWKAICTNPEELNYVINELETGKEERIKSEPMLQPYNPYPDIFPDLFKKEEKTIEDIPKKKPSKSPSRASKSSPLPILVEEDEEEMSNINLARDQDSKQPAKCENHSQLDHSQQPSTLSSLSPIDSQVKLTIENLINKVVSTFGNFIRPLSRNSTPEKTDPNPIQQKGRKRQTKRNKATEEVLPRRSSSRIQQLQQKKVAELVDLKSSSDTAVRIKVESSSSQLEETHKYSAPKIKKQRNSIANDSKKSKKRRKKGQSWRSRKSGKKWDKDDSDLSSTSSLTVSECDELDDLDETVQDTNYDDEFACEDEDTNIEPVIVKRARTARPSFGPDECGDQTVSFIEEDKPCERCDKSNDPELILLCDMCDNGYHLACCIPPLMIVPDGDWFCPPCEHKMLLSKLKELYTSITDILDAKERERIKKQKSRQNVIKKESIPKPQPPKILPDPIDFNSDFDTASETEDPGSDESFQASSATEPEDDEDDEDDEDEDEDEDTEVESGDESESSIDEIAAIKYSKTKTKRGSRRRRDSYSSEESDYQPSRGRRRAAAAKVSYKESTDEEEDEIATVQTAKKPKKHTLSSDESHTSWKSRDNSSVEDDDDDLTENDDDRPADDTYEETNNNNNVERLDDNAECINFNQEVGDQAELETELDDINHALSCARSMELEIDDVERSIDLEKQNELRASQLHAQHTIEQIGAPLYPPMTSSLESYIPSAASSSQASSFSPADPMEQLNQYCNDITEPATSMFKSYNDILSKRNPAFASKHPPFYSEDVTNPSNKQ